MGIANTVGKNRIARVKGQMGLRNWCGYRRDWKYGEQFFQAEEESHQT